MNLSYKRVSNAHTKKSKQKSKPQTVARKSAITRWKEIKSKDNWWDRMVVFWQSISNEDKLKIMKHDDFNAWDKLRYAKMDKEQANKSLLTKKEYDGFRIDKTGMSLYDDMFTEGRYYEVAKDIHYVLVEMTADEYLKEVYHMFLKFDGAKYTTWESATSIHESSVKKFSKMMKKGTKFNMPMIDWKRGGQEGRNRAVAFKKVFGSDAKMPVMILQPYKVEEREPIYASDD